jgi:iron complex outermembrane receptor protein
MKKLQVASFMTLVLVLIINPTHGRAEDNPTTARPEQPPSDARKYAIEEVVVTARRTQENLQEVPLSITAFSSDELARESINTAQDLMGKVGSLVIGPNSTMRSAESPNIRGQGATFGSNPGVVMYWAEVPLPTDSFMNNQGGPGMFFDVQSMQVLKGPQGTLFGRNTTGGAFLLDPVKPQDTFSARVQGETGNYNDTGLEFVVNTPLISDRLLLRAGAQKLQRDGFTKDVLTGDDYDDKNYWTGRLGLTFRIGESIENTFLWYRTLRDENGTGNVLDGMNSEQIAGFLASYLGTPLDPNLPANDQFGCRYFNSQAPSVDCGQDLVAEQNARDIRHVSLSANPLDRLSTGAYINTFSWNINDDLKLRNILSKSYYQRRINWDQDGSRAELNDVADSTGYSSDTESLTGELQLQGSVQGIGLTYVVGAYYEKREPDSLQENRSVALFVPTTQLHAIANRSRAIYTQGSLDLQALNPDLGAWILTAGVRRTEDEVFGESRLITPAFTNYIDDKTRQFATTWLLSASYQFDAAMAYGKISKGYKSGGFTALAANVNNAYYDPEYVTNYELGIKSDFEPGGIPVRLNAAVFLSDYKDMQRTSAESYEGSFGVTTFNSGESEIKGIEMDFIVLATDRLRLSGNYSYMKGEFKEFTIPRSSMTPQRDCNRDNISEGELGDYSCIPFTDIPKHQYSVSVNYELPVPAEVGIVETTINYSWVDKRYTAPITIPEAEPGAWLGSFGVVNATVSWREIFGTRLDLQLFGTNLTDEEYRISNSNVWNELGYKNSIWGEPRMYGLRATYRWGDA